MQESKKFSDHSVLMRASAFCYWRTDCYKSTSVTFL